MSFLSSPHAFVGRQSSIDARMNKHEDHRQQHPATVVVILTPCHCCCNLKHPAAAVAVNDRSSGGCLGRCQRPSTAVFGTDTEVPFGGWARERERGAVVVCMLIDLVGWLIELIC
jgi:hypothetical protein